MPVSSLSLEIRAPYKAIRCPRIPSSLWIQLRTASTIVVTASAHFTMPVILTFQGFFSAEINVCTFSSFFFTYQIHLRLSNFIGGPIDLFSIHCVCSPIEGHQFASTVWLFVNEAIMDINVNSFGKVTANTYHMLRLSLVL